MSWSNIKLIFHREARDQLRDRRTLFMIAVLPILLYPLMGIVVLKVLEFVERNRLNEILAVLPTPIVQDLMKKRMRVTQERAASDQRR